MEAKLKYTSKKYNFNIPELDNLLKFYKNKDLHFLKINELNEQIDKLIALTDKYFALKPYIYEYILIVSSCVKKDNLINLTNFCWNKIVELQNIWKLDECLDIVSIYIKYINFLTVQDVINLFNYNKIEQYNSIKKLVKHCIDFTDIMSVMRYLYDNKILFDYKDIETIIFNNYKKVNIDELKHYYYVDDSDQICIDLVTCKYKMKKLPAVSEEHLEKLKKYIFSYINDIKKLKKYVEHYKLKISDNCINYYCYPLDDKILSLDIYMWLVRSGGKPNCTSICNIMKQFIPKNRKKAFDIAEITLCLHRELL